LTIKKVGMTLKRREWLKITIRGVMRTLFELKALECTGQPKPQRMEFEQFTEKIQSNEYNN
jgi:hypothetical protein